MFPFFTSFTLQIVTNFFVGTRKQIIVEQNKWRTLSQHIQGFPREVQLKECLIWLRDLIYYVAEFKVVLLSACFRWKSFLLRFEEAVFFSLLQLTIKSMQTKKQENAWKENGMTPPPPRPRSWW